MVGVYLVGGDIFRASPVAPHRPLRTIKHIMLEFPLSENEVPAAEGALDHFTQSSEAFTLAFFVLNVHKYGSIDQ